jgi:hypothetical protein
MSKFIIKFFKAQILVSLTYLPYLLRTFLEHYSNYAQMKVFKLALKIDYDARRLPDVLVLFCFYKKFLEKNYEW